MGRLHDARLVSLLYEPELKQVVIRFDVGGATDLRVIAKGVREVTVTQKEPWGPSTYVDDIPEPTPLGGTGFAMDVALQSGDSIRLMAASLEPSFDSWPTVTDPSRLPLG